MAAKKDLLLADRRRYDLWDRESPWSYTHVLERLARKVACG